MMIKSPNQLCPEKKDSVYVFLCGPIQGAPDWQSEVPDIEGVTWINPKREGMDGFDWEEQVKWETMGLSISDFVLTWIPPMKEEIPGRDYAQTTKIEIMENLCLGKNIILGIDPSIHTRRYLAQKYKTYEPKEIVYTSLEDCLVRLQERIKERNGELFFTSDTHFNQERSLELNKRPFRNLLDMNLTMIRNWNKVVSPKDTVYHLGDFGDFSYAKYLNGNIKLLKGNYERNDPSLEIPDYIKAFDSPFIHLKVNDKIMFDLCHEPLNSPRDCFTLFGHIHGKQWYKRFGLDVGVDPNHFTPLSIDLVLWRKSVIENYSDDEVFCY